MNIISLLLLSIVVAAFLTVAYRYFIQKKGRKSCCDGGSDQCSGCAGCALHDACKKHNNKTTKQQDNQTTR